MAGLCKQHFNKIAEILNNSRGFPIEIRETDKPIITNIDLLVKELSNYFKTQNPRFIESQFIRNCLK